MGRKALERARQNKDILGRTWVLAECGHRELERCQKSLIDIRNEVLGFSTLFKSIGSVDILDGEGLYGVGVSLERILKRVERTEARLSRVVTKATDTEK